MLTLGPIGFATPWLLAALLGLPALWWLLRAVPPAPIRRRFPGVILLLGLKDDQIHTDKTPWWLLLLRMLALAAMILGFAGPVLHPKPQDSADVPLLILLDGSWADASGWAKRQERVAQVLTQAERSGRLVSVAVLSAPPTAIDHFMAADLWQTQLAGVQPNPWGPDIDAVQGWLAGLAEPQFDTLWLSDGLAGEWRAEVLKTLQDNGRVTVLQSAAPVVGLIPAQIKDGALQISALRSATGQQASVTVLAIGLDPGGAERVLAQTTLRFEPDQQQASTTLDLPPELRNRISRLTLQGVASAGAVSLSDDSLRRPEVALIAPHNAQEELQLLSPLHYLRKALEPTADLINGGLEDVLPANPDVIVLADIAKLTEDQSAGLREWVEKGGLLLRFAGPRMAGSDLSRRVEDALMPVRLRSGGRMVGGTLSWGEPKALRPFPPDSPFFGLKIPDDVKVNAQVMAQPDPKLAQRMIAALTDGTPLVTRKQMGAGQVVLFHVTASADWSSLPLSGLFVQMLERLAVSARQTPLSEAELSAGKWMPIRLLDAFGQLDEAGERAGVEGSALAAGVVSAGTPPGVYQSHEQGMALNVLGSDSTLEAANWPAGVAVQGLSAPPEIALKAAFLLAAFALLMLDIIASLWLSGRLIRPKAVVPVLLIAALTGLPETGRAQEPEPQHIAEHSDDFAINATAELVLGHITTGDARVDDMAHAGLRGLSDVLFQRTTIEPADPIAIDLERDDLTFFPFLYWPVTASMPVPSKQAYAKLNRYLRGGGMILFDTRDGDIASYGTGSTPAGLKLQKLALGLDIPPLEPLPQDHVLTRSFYLLQDFPGRHRGRAVWVEAAPADAKRAEGMPFRNLNDGVTPVIIGGNDWAAAWAVGPKGDFLAPVGRGFTGKRQREMAYRFGVNLIMHVLTGNYKSDQVHVPALLERLGE
ncbi:MAG: LytTR family transcriptional regulator [Rhodobacterales bacterium]|nr:MAG: LytTR family transcriptional regulator [Rhodobacterales bacterium]